MIEITKERHAGSELPDTRRVRGSAEKEPTEEAEKKQPERQDENQAGVVSGRPRRKHFKASQSHPLCQMLPGGRHLTRVRFSIVFLYVSHYVSEVSTAAPSMRLKYNACYRLVQGKTGHLDFFWTGYML